MTWTYLSPYCKSPTLVGCFMLWRAHSTDAVPVALWPRPGFVSARLTAWCLEQVLFYAELWALRVFDNRDSWDSRWFTYRVFFLLSCVQIFFVFFLVDKVGPTVSEARICLITRYIFSLEAKVRIKSDKLSMYKAKICPSISAYFTIFNKSIRTLLLVTPSPSWASCWSKARDMLGRELRTPLLWLPLHLPDHVLVRLILPCSYASISGSSACMECIYPK